jgi:hypothetical protein
MPARAGAGRALGIGALLCAALLGACGESEYRYISNSAENTHLRVPSDWRIFEEDEFFAQVEDLSPQQLQVQKARQWIVAFDSAPKPSLEHISIPGQHPAGMVRVRGLGEQDHDIVSLKVLRSFLFSGTDPLELAASGDPNVEVLSNEDVTRPGGLRGIHLVVNLRGATGQEFVTTNYVALTDTATSRLYLLFIGCRATCYEQHKSQIESIVESWTVRER